MSFESLGLEPTLLSALQEAGFDTPTSVQAAAIPQAIAGQDLMVSSQTGSGKTAAFMLPALNRIAKMPANKGTGVQVLVLTPTRELALQVNDATRQYGKNLRDLRTATVVGGMPYGAQLKALSRRVDVLVATPGRLLDHLQAGRVKLNTVHTLVLDEADRMLDMGFIEDIETIVGRLPADRQTLLFSATLDGTVAKLAAKMMREPQRIEIAGAKEKHSNITQSLLYADDAAHKMQLLDHVLRDTALDQAIVFTATKRGADDLADRLSDQGFAAAALHGDMNQRQRTRTLSMLQKRQLKVLVATDVAARGIDVQGISHAVNFDLPMQAEDYVHRIGRTGRAGRDGLAFTLATHAERHKVRRIEHFIGQTLTPQIIAGLEPKRTARPPYERSGTGKPGFGKRPFNRDSRGGFGARPFDGPRREFREGAGPQRELSGDRPQRAWRDGPRPVRPEGEARPYRAEGEARPFRAEGDRRPADRGFQRNDQGYRAEGAARKTERSGDEGGFRAERDFRQGDRPQRPEGAFRSARSEAGMRADKAAREGNHAGRATEGYARPTGRPAFDKGASRSGKPFKPAYAGRRD
ncbi:RNA helicase [Bordetella genomosp. 8]|uniref:RNA helicase n=1 Tax=Bordetella genomosp. 8 TaxID=1416806 RepID=A0A1W6YSE9_9BORD|nr:DEAD/DEAH box helicase [Bordetella genomosp. 8]ARP84025.1 RNA helicase [Bordetella genomosp. 8]